MFLNELFLLYMYMLHIYVHVTVVYFQYEVERICLVCHYNHSKMFSHSTVLE